MVELKLENRTITEKDVFVIAEIGANHMGDLDLCESMIIEAAKCGADAVKLQKRDNLEMFTQDAYNQPYDNELSYGKTYGEHREHLDWFGRKEYVHLISVARWAGILLFSTPFEQRSADFLLNLNMPLYKIASCDVTNLPLVKHVASFQKPMIISTGGAELSEIEALVDAINPINPNFAILHCISTYPNQDDQMNVNFLWSLGLETGKLVGLSSHHPGILPHLLARARGASIFESHFTLNRGARGTDHGFSLEPAGLAQLCEDLPRVKEMLGFGNKAVLKEEREGFIKKMGKGIYLLKDMEAGETIGPNDVCIKSPAGGISPAENVAGRILAVDVSHKEPLEERFLR